MLTKKYFKNIFPNRAHLSELAPKGHSVLNVTAVDGDKSEQEESVDYDIFGYGKDLFHIKQRTGEIIYNGGADYEREGGKEYTLYVVATDRGVPPKNISVPIKIYIDDENDNPPMFVENRYIIYIDENFPAMQAFPGPILNATDADSGMNAEMKFTITSGNTEGIFHNPNGKGSLMIVKGMSLDYETNPFHRLTLRAVDCVSCPSSSVKLSAFVTVDIYVNDVNEFQPYFPVKHYLEDLRENSTEGTLVFTAHAVDGDGGRQGILEYSLMRSMDYEKFSIDKVTGEVRSLVVFDYEDSGTKKLFNLRIVAREESQGYHDLADATIRLIDRDESKPRFLKTEYNFEVPGTAKAGDYIGRVYASDDDNGDAGIVVFSFVRPNPYFHIEPLTGNITVARTLHEELSTGEEGLSRQKRALTSNDVKLSIQVSSGQPDSLSAVTDITIAIDRACDGCAAPVGSLHSDEALNGGVLAGIILACIIVIILTVVAIIIFVYHRRNPRKSVPNYSSDSTIDFDPPPSLPPDRAYVDAIRSSRQHRSNLMASDTSDQSHNSASSGRGSAEAEEDDEEITRINSRTLMHSSQAFRQKAMPDSGIQHDDDTLSESTAQTHQEYLANLGIDTSKIGKSKVANNKQLGRSAESMHQFSDEGGGEGGVDTDFEKITDFETDEEALANVQKGGKGTSFLEPDTQNVGSLSNVINSEEVNSGSYNWDYLIDWGPQYQPLAHVFSEIAKLKDESIKPKKQPIKTVPQRQFSGMLKQQPKVRMVPPPIITNAPPMARLETKQHNQHPHQDPNIPPPIPTSVPPPMQSAQELHNHRHHQHHQQPHHPHPHRQDQSPSGTSHHHHHNHHHPHPPHSHHPPHHHQHFNHNHITYQQQQQQLRNMPYQYQPLPQQQQQQQKQYHPTAPQGHHVQPPSYHSLHPQQPQQHIDNNGPPGLYPPPPPSHPPPPLPNKEQQQSASSSSSESRSHKASTTNISGLPSLPRSPISYESSLTSAAMTPSLTPSLSPLATRSPSISPVVSSGHNTPGQNGHAPRSKTHSLSSSSEKEFTI